MIVGAPIGEDAVFWLAFSTALALVLLVGGLVAGRWAPRWRKRSQEALAEARAWAAELAAAAEEARATAWWGSRLAELTSSLDVDDVLSRALNAAGEIRGVDAAMIVLRPIGGGRIDPLVASYQMSAGEMTSRLGDLPEGVRVSTVSYRYPDEVEPLPRALRGAVVVPLRAEEQQIGSLAVFWREPGREPSDQDVVRLEELAQRAAVAARNAEQFANSRELADRDLLTGLHNRRFLEEVLRHDIPRAHRYGRPLTLLMVAIDGFSEFADRVGAAKGDEALADLAGGIHATMRSSDVACRFDGGEFAVLMPDSVQSDAATLAARLRGVVHAQSAALDDLDLSAGIAQLIRDETVRRLVERAGEALSRAKRAGRGQTLSFTTGEGTVVATMEREPGGRNGWT